MTEKDAYIKQLENTVETLQEQVAYLTELIKNMQKARFGSSSEKTVREELEDQLSLFNEAELEADSKANVFST